MQAMRTTVDIPDELFRRAKSEAALRGRKLRDLVEEGLRLVLEKEPARRAKKKSLGRSRAQARCMKRCKISAEFLKAPQISRRTRSISTISAGEIRHSF